MESSTLLRPILFRSSALPEPGENFARVKVGREDGIEHLCDRAVVDHKGQSLDQRPARNLHRGKSQGTREFEALVGEDRESQPESPGQLRLISRVLRRQSEDARSGSFEVRV
jgi:hypothetical protein